MATEREARDLAVLLTPDGNLAPAWVKGKSVTPLPVGERLDATQAARLTAGARAIGAADLLYAPLGEDDPAVTTREATADAAARPPVLIWTPDRQGAVLFPAPGYALLAGTEPFMAAAVPEGIDEARARFTRYARKRAAIRPELLAVAAKYSPAHTAWSRPADVAPNTAAATNCSYCGTSPTAPSQQQTSPTSGGRPAEPPDRTANGSEVPWRNSSTGCSCSWRTTRWIPDSPSPPTSRPQRSTQR